MDFTEEQIKDAKKFGQFYFDLVENHKNTVKYYVSSDVTLDWFGQTVKGEKKVNLFLKSTLSTIKHYFTDPAPVEKIGFRETHVIKLHSEQKKKLNTLMSPPRTTYFLRTPTKQTQPSTSSTPTGDKTTPRVNSNEHLQVSPAKKFKAAPSEWSDAEETIEPESGISVKYITCDGSVEFHKPSSKKLQAETKWKRPCKLSVGYTSTNKQDYTIHLIIYEGNVKCRRNLMKDFSSEDEEN